MGEKLIDMHVHSNCSDGTSTVQELVAIAKKANLAAFALTDHDTIIGVTAAQDAAKDAGIEVISGIELSTSYHDRDVHVLGLGLDTGNACFLESLRFFQDARQERNRKMIKKLNEHGVPISEEDLEREYPGCIWTRAHFGELICKMGFVKKKSEAFISYIGDDAPCFVPREQVLPHQAVELIHKGGGFAILAHPLQYNLGDEGLKVLISSLKECGLDGIEALYSTHTDAENEAMKNFAKEFELPYTGGSDFHGANKKGIFMGTGKGSLKVPYRLWTILKELHKTL